MQQATLEIHAEDFKKRESLIIKRLEQYRTIDVDIQVQQRRLRGIGLIHEPRITAAPPEQDYLPMLKHISLVQSDNEREIAATVEKYVSPSDVGQYASSYRVARKLRETFADDEEEDARLQDAYDILTRRRHEEDDVRLTDTERVAEKRLEERERAYARLQELLAIKEIVGFALEQMEQWYHDEYLILWHKYVLQDPWKKVCEIVGKASKGTPLTEDEYRLARKKALKHFDQWAVGLC